MKRVFVLAFALAGCGGILNVPKAPPTSLQALTGWPVALAAGDSAQSLQVEVRDALDRPLAGVSLKWNVTQGTGKIIDEDPLTDENGRGEATYQAGTSVGTETIEVMAGSKIAQSFEVAVEAGPADHLQLVSGSGQSASLRTLLPAPVVVKVLDRYDNVVKDAPIYFQVTRGDGEAVDRKLVSDSAGLVSATVRTGLSSVNSFLTVSGFGAALADEAGSGTPTLTLPFTTTTTSALGYAATQTHSETTEVPGMFAFADFDEDGKLDIASLSVNEASMLVLLGNAGAGFAKGNKYVIASSSYMAIQAADIDEDGHADVLITYSGALAADSKLAFFKGNGAGAFAAPVLSDIGVLNPISINLADLNRDGHLDVVVPSNNGSSVAVLLGAGTGTFSAPSFVTVGSCPVYAAFGDFNEDGILDMTEGLQGCGAGTNIGVQLGNGTGGFGATTTYFAGSVSGQVVTGDYNHDGHLDILSANDSNGIDLFFGVGDGTFGARNHLDLGAWSNGVAFGDFNGDGKLDIAAMAYNNSGYKIVPGDGTGAFGAPTATFALTSGVSKPWSDARMTVDLNGDGKLDFISPSLDDLSNSVLWRLGQ